MKIRFKKLDHIQLTIPVGAEDKAREFYGGVLGLAEVEKPDALKSRGGLWFEIVGIGLHLGVEETQPRSKRHPAFEIENLAETRAYLQAHGVETRDEIVLAGMQRFSFYDCFGNRIELIERTQV